MAEEKVIRSDISGEIVPDEQVVKVIITFGRGRAARQRPRELDAAEDEIGNLIAVSRERGGRRGGGSRRRSARTDE